MSSLLVHVRDFLPEGVLQHELPTRPYQYTAIAALLLITWVVYQALQPQTSTYPVINDDKAWFSLRAKAEYFKNAKQLLADGSRKVRHSGSHFELGIKLRFYSSLARLIWSQTVEMC
jgi:hypothetical protein